MNLFETVGRIILGPAVLQLFRLRLHSRIISHLVIPIEKKPENFHQPEHREKGICLD
jgi:hypothetical protein